MGISGSQGEYQLSRQKRKLGYLPRRKNNKILLLLLALTARRDGKKSRILSSKEYDCRILFPPKFPCIPGDSSKLHRLI